jgi:hypothetical protein
MNSSNIAVVIGPNIIRPVDAANSPDSFGDTNTIVQLLVDYVDVLYPEVKEEKRKGRKEREGKKGKERKGRKEREEKKRKEKQ